MEGSTYNEVNAIKVEMFKLIKNVTKKGKGQKIFLYCYFAGHGCSDLFQYYILNEADPKLALYPAEQNMRMLAEVGHGLCYLLAVYDICREDAGPFKQIISKYKAEAEEKAKK